MRNRLPLFFITTSLFWFALYAYVPFVAPYAEELQADVRLIGLIAGSYGFVQMIIRFPLGIMSDISRRRKAFIIAGLIFASVSGILVFMLPSPMILLAARSFAGAAASSWVVFTVLGASYNKPNDTVGSVGLLSAYSSGGRLLALLLGGIVAETVGIPYAFLLASVVGFIGLLLGFGVKENRPEATVPPKLSTLLDVARDRQLLFTSLLAILAQYISWATTFGFTPLVAQQLNATNFQLGMFGVVATLPGLIISPFVGKLLNKFGAKTVLSLSFAVMAAACFAMPYCIAVWQLFAVQLINNIGLVVLATCLMGLCIKGISGERRATAMGFFQAVYGLGMFLGPLVTGVSIHAFGMGASLVLVGAVGIIGAIFSIVCCYKKYIS